MEVPLKIETVTGKFLRLALPQNLVELISIVYLAKLPAKQLCFLLIQSYITDIVYIDLLCVS